MDKWSFRWRNQKGDRPPGVEWFLGWDVINRNSQDLASGNPTWCFGCARSCLSEAGPQVSNLIGILSRGRKKTSTLLFSLLQRAAEAVVGARALCKCSSCCSSLCQHTSRQIFSIPHYVGSANVITSLSNNDSSCCFYRAYVCWTLYEVL